MTPSSVILKRIEEFAPEVEGEALSFLRGLIRVPTENPPGLNYEKLVSYASGILEDLDYRVEVVEVRDERYYSHIPGALTPRPNIVATLGSHNTGQVLFNGHYDVVPAGEGWIHPPYEAEVVGGRVYGRGASDMKSGIAAQVYAVELARRVLDDHEQIKRVAHHIVADEETVGNTNAGTGYLAEKGYLSPRRVSCVVFTEPFGVTNICIGHRGALWGHVEVQGAKSHGGFPDEGADAIRAATQCVECLYRSVHRKRRESRYPIEPPSARRPTMVVGSISGGTWANTVADRASFWYVRRLIPEEDLDVARREIQRCLHQTQKSNPGTGLINTEVYSTPSIMTRKSTCVYRALDSAIRRVTHVKPKALVSPGTFDMRFAVNQGVDAIGYGPGRLELSHTTDEWLDIAEFNASIRIMALALIQLIAKPK